MEKEKVLTEEVKDQEIISTEVKPEEVKSEPVEEPKDNNKEITDKIKTLSSEFKLNLFSKEGVLGLTDLIKTEREEKSNINTQLEDLNRQVSEYKQKEKYYENRLVALELGFTSESLPEVLALASVNIKEGQSMQEGLKIVKEKYGSMFGSTPEAGILHNDTQARNKERTTTDFERYAFNNPKYKNYYKNK